MKILKLALGAINTNCYIISNEGKCVIIDPGDDADKIENFLKENELKPIAVLLTHGHFDHIMAVNRLKEEYGIKVYAYEAEQELLIDENLNCSLHFGYLYATEADVLLKDSDIVNLAGIDIKVIATPGHTAGSCCFYIENENVLFAGDTLFFRSVGRCDLPTGDEDTLLESLQKLIKLPDETVVYCGHGPKTDIGSESRLNPYIRGLV